MSSSAIPLDARGVRHPPAAGDVRIVSLVPSITELLVDLGLAERLVGRTRFCVHPAPILANIANVGGTKQVKWERLEDLCPTHVVVNIDENTKDVAARLPTLSSRPRVIVTHPLAPEDNLELYRLLGRIFGRHERAEELCDLLASALGACDDMASGLAPLPVIYLIWRDPWMTVSPNTYIGRVLERVGLQNWVGTSAERYPTVQLDQVSDSVDYVLLSSEPYPFKHDDVQQLVERDSALEGRVYEIDGEMVSWYGSRAIKGLRYAKRFAMQLRRAATMMQSGVQSAAVQSERRHAVTISGGGETPALAWSEGAAAIGAASTNDRRGNTNSEA